MHSRKHLDERRFAGAILADDRMDFTRLEVEIDRFQGVGRPETLVELLENQQGRFRPCLVAATLLLSLVHRRPRFTSRKRP